jgi:hypothetical protein
VIGVRDFTRHGFRKIGPDPYEEGAPITYDFLLPEGRSFSITNYYWAPETYLVMLRGAGFRQAEWHMLEISSDAARRFSPSFFTDLIAQAPIAAFVASK